MPKGTPFRPAPKPITDTPSPEQAGIDASVKNGEKEISNLASTLFYLTETGQYPYDKGKGGLVERSDGRGRVTHALKRAEDENIPRIADLLKTLDIDGSKTLSGTETLVLADAEKFKATVDAYRERHPLPAGKKDILQELSPGEVAKYLPTVPADKETSR